MAATTAAATAVELLPPGAVAVATVATGAAALAAGAAAAAAVIDAFDVFNRKHRATQGTFLRTTLLRLHPERSEEEVRGLVGEELNRQREFERKQKERLQRDLPRAYAIEDKEERRRKVQSILDREKRYARLREKSMSERAVTISNNLNVEAVSPQGAYWKLGKVRQHTPDCVAMGEKFWPWSVLRAYHPKLHPGCACELLTKRQAVEMGLMHEDQVPDEADAIRRAADIMRKYGALREAADPDELQEALAEALAEAAVPSRYALRYPKGTKQGGEYRPRRGGHAEPVARRLVVKAMRDLIHEQPTSPAQRRRDHVGEWKDVAGRQVFVPEHRAFERTIAGRTWYSPPGTTEVYEQKEFLRRRPEIPRERQDEITDTAVRLMRDRREEAQRVAERALSKQMRSLHPAKLGAPSKPTHSGMLDAGFQSVRNHADPVTHEVTWEYVHAPSGARAQVGYGRDKVHEVTSVEWEPGMRPLKTAAPLDRSPRTFEEWRQDIASIAHAIAAEAGHKPPSLMGIVVDTRYDHRGEYGWDGVVRLGRDVRTDIETMVEKVALKQPLTATEARGAYASYVTAIHEALHTVNPVSQRDYEDPVARSIEETIAEELAHVEAVKALRAQGLDEVLRWVVTNPGDTKVEGSYSHYRDRIGKILALARVEPEKNRSVLGALKFAFEPSDRQNGLAGLVAGGVADASDLHGNHEGALAYVREKLTRADHLTESSDDEIIFPRLVRPDLSGIEPHPAIEHKGAELRVGTWVDVEHTGEGGHLWPQTGFVDALTAGRGGVPLADVRFPDGSVKRSLPLEALTVSAPSQGRLNIRDALTWQGETFRPGDHVSYLNGTGERSHARVDEIVRTANYDLRAPERGWQIFATTGEASTEPGEPVILTLDRARGLRGESGPVKVPGVEISTERPPSETPDRLAPEPAGGPIRLPSAKSLRSELDAVAGQELGDVLDAWPNVSREQAERLARYLRAEMGSYGMLSVEKGQDFGQAMGAIRRDGKAALAAVERALAKLSEAREDWPVPDLIDALRKADAGEWESPLSALIRGHGYVASGSPGAGRTVILRKPGKATITVLFSESDGTAMFYPTDVLTVEEAREVPDFHEQGFAKPDKLRCVFCSRDAKKVVISGGRATPVCDRDVERAKDSDDAEVSGLDSEMAKLLSGTKVWNTTEQDRSPSLPGIGRVHTREAAYEEALHPRDRRGRWILDSLNPTGGVFVGYDPQVRATAPLGGDLTTLDKTMGVSPDEPVRIYRGAPKSQTEIRPGDFITTNPQLAKDYAGDGHVIGMTVPASHVLDDASEPLGEEYIYRPPGEGLHEALYEERLHPRGRGGKWVAKLMATPGMQARRAAHDVHDAFSRKEGPRLADVLSARAEARPKFEADLHAALREARPRFGQGKVQFHEGSDPDPALRERVQKAARFFPAEWIENAGPVQVVSSPSDAHLRAEVARSRVSTLLVKDSKSIAAESYLVHEMTHWLEERNPEVSQAAHAFLARRTEGKEPVPLSDLTNTIYKGSMALDGGFVEPYMGRLYDHDATEVLSMAMEAFSGGAVRIEDDPDHLEWALSTLAGEPQETVEAKPWRAPPSPVGKQGESKGGKGYSSDAAYGTNTALGHVAEDAFVRIVGGRILHPEGKGAQSPLDVHFDGYGFEVKGVSTKTLGYKATPKPYEVEQKQRAAEELGLKPALAIVVIDSDGKQAHAYFRDGLKGGRLSENTGWQYLGSTDLPDAEAVERAHVQEAYVEGLHPRGRAGRWVEKWASRLNLHAAIEAKDSNLIRLPEPGPERDELLRDIGIGKRGMKARRTALAEKLLGDARDTRAKYSVGHGVYEPGRAKLHDEIVEAALEGHSPPSGKPVAFVLAGGNASGKSRALRLPENEKLVPGDAVSVNFDDVKDRLPEFGELAKAHDPGSAELTHFESADVAGRIIHESIERGLNMAIDVTAGGPPGRFEKLVDDLAGRGYEVRILMVDAPLDEAKESMIRRGLRTGRFIPIDVMERIHAQSVARHEEWRGNPNVASFAVYRRAGAKLTRVAEGGGGEWKVLDPKLYDDVLAKAEGEGGAGAARAGKKQGKGRKGLKRSRQGWKEFVEQARRQPVIQQNELLGERAIRMHAGTQEDHEWMDTHWFYSARDPEGSGRLERISGAPGPAFEEQHERIMESGARLDAEVRYRTRAEEKRLRDATKARKAKMEEVIALAAEEKGLEYEATRGVLIEKYGWDPSITVEQVEERHRRYLNELAKVRATSRGEPDQVILHANMDVHDAYFKRLNEPEIVAVRSRREEAQFEQLAPLVDEEAEARRVLPSARRAAAFGMLREIRSFGRRGELQFDLRGDENDHLANSALLEAQTWLPAAWLSSSNHHPTRLVAGWEEYRGHYSGKGRQSGDAFVVGSPSPPAPGVETGVGTMVHELVHRTEHVRDGVRGAEWAFYWRRTVRGVLEGMEEKRLLSEITGSSSYADDEVARVDEFTNAYSGKSYGDQMGSSYELLTMGIQDFVTGAEGILENDEEYRQFVYGSLALL